MLTTSYEPISTEQMAQAARDLARVCPILRPIIAKVGACALKPKKMRAPYESLVRAIANQQLNGKAAQTILDRFCALTPDVSFPTPEGVLKLKPEQLRGVGFSGAKVLAIRDIAEKAAQGLVPSSRDLLRMGDDEIVERLVALRGVGRWTVEMMLIFQLGRHDILPVDDFGVRRGFQLASGEKDMRKPKDLLAYGERWRPWRTIASWYLWRATEILQVSKAPSAPKKAAATKVVAKKVAVAKKPVAAKKRARP